MSSPYHWVDPVLTEEDLTTYRAAFADGVNSLIPCRRVDLVPWSLSAKSGGELPPEWEAGLKLVWKKGKPVVDNEVPMMFLPVWSGNAPYATAILTGGEQSLYERYSVKALLEYSGLISENFLEIKVNGTDPLTGLLNSVLFRRGLSSLVNRAGDAILVLLEIYPRHRDAAQGLAFLQRVAGSIRSMAGSSVPIYHLGNGTFAMFWRDIDLGKARDMADVVLHRFQLDGIPKCHIGMIQVRDYSAVGAEKVFDLAWSAVVKARQRGSLSRFTYCSQAELDKHPFRPLMVKTANVFKSLWRGLEQFSVVALSTEADEGIKVITDFLKKMSGDDFVFVGLDTRSIFLLYKDIRGPSALDKVKLLQEKVQRDHGVTCSAGVADFPCLDHKRGEIPVNARKALYHSSYYGPGSAVLLDSVSFNVSGDVYYNEGDIIGAIRDYEIGLALDPANINLLNSIGVAHARLDNLKAATGYFEKALQMNDRDYMALYNLGAAWLANGRDDLAAGYLEKALAGSEGNFDLALQLAGVYCRTEEYDKVVGLLEKDTIDSTGSRAGWELGAAFRCLGEAWRNLGENGKAVECLQKAIVYNPADARVLSMLGEVYDIEGQGGELALDLCRQALELDDTLWDNWYRLGLVKYRQGQFGGAITDLQKSLRLNRKNVKAVGILAEIYDSMGKERLAGRMLAKEKKISINTSYNH
ncbi:MAG: tetratricopeptide repeat protein [Proteobacteria bacterium]|nr:tetratricopeptide repeat protein [Pseudomonadota bacterium]MBU1737026.1 tetratricopeptide repeat protein [Pseudomonadota bacterium]